MSSSSSMSFTAYLAVQFTFVHGDFARGIMRAFQFSFLSCSLPHRDIVVPFVEDNILSSLDCLGIHTHSTDSKAEGSGISGLFHIHLPVNLY